MEEMASFAEFVQQNDDEVSHLYDYTEYAYLYNYGDEFNEFSPWDGLDRFGNYLAPQESILDIEYKLQKQDAELDTLVFRNLTEGIEGTSGLGQRDSDNISDVAAGFSTPELNVCAHCGKGGTVSRCGRCKIVYYCSKEHQTANYQTHKVVCRKAAKSASPPALSPSTKGSHAFDQDNRSTLQSGMLELLDMFQAIGESTSKKKKKAILKKCVHLCEQILGQGNPIREPLPQVVAMLEEAKAMLQMYEKEEEGGCCPSDKKATPVVVEDFLAVAMSPRDLLEAQIKHALHLAESDKSQKSELVEVPDQETKDAYIHQGIWFCRKHKREVCTECVVDHRLLNEIRRAGAQMEVDIEVLIKEQRRLQEIERQAPYSDSEFPDEETPMLGKNREGDRAKSEEVAEDLTRAREGEEDEIFRYFADFHIRE